MSKNCREWSVDTLVGYLCGFDSGAVWLEPPASDKISGGFKIVGFSEWPPVGDVVEEGVVRRCLARGLLRRRGGKFLVTETAYDFDKRMTGGGDGFRAQHQLRVSRPMAVAPGVSRSVDVNECESSLGWLRKRKDKNGAPLISDAQFEAGERLACDFHRAQLSPRVTANWLALSSSRRERRASPGSGVEMSLSAFSAKERVIEALEVVGPELSGVLLDVCCFSQGLEVAEKSAGWPQRSGKVVLQLALTCLARHYGLIADDDARRPIRRRIEVWVSSEDGN